MATALTLSSSSGAGRVSLLCVVVTWTVLSVYLLVCAQTLEVSAQETVRDLRRQSVSVC